MIFVPPGGIGEQGHDLDAVGLNVGGLDGSHCHDHSLPTCPNKSDSPMIAIAANIERIENWNRSAMRSG